MHAGEVIFQQLLDGKIQYRVPLFQRTYSWTNVQWDQIWNDVLEIYAMGKPRNHFIGAIVTQPLADAPERAAKHLLIDGQQRLTTLSVLLACIWKRAHDQPESWPKLADEIMETCLANKYATVPEDSLKLRPTQRDRAPYESITKGEAPAGRSRLRAAHEWFLSAIAEGDLEGKPLDLAKLKLCITSYLDLVSITLDPEDSPHRIFESLNNTGMRLGSSDLIRNFLFMNIQGEEAQENAYSRLWYPMQEATKTDLDDFFWRYLMMDGELPRYDETFTEVKQRFPEQFGANAVSALEEFSRFALYYRQLGELEEEHALSEAFDSQAARLNRWQIDVAYPFLMRSLDWHSRGLVGLDAVVEAMKMIESYVVRRTVCNIPTNRLRRIFARMSLSVDTADFTSTARKYLLENQWPSDDEFKEEFVKFHLYISARQERTRLVLWSLEESFGHKEPPDAESITLEHIMPQTLTDEWRQMLGDRYAEVHSKWLHTV